VYFNSFSHDTLYYISEVCSNCVSVVPCVAEFKDIEILVEDEDII
jgi:hypothetical protein